MPAQKFPTTVMCFPGILVPAYNQEQLDDLLKGERRLQVVVVTALAGCIVALLVFAI